MSLRKDVMDRGVTNMETMNGKMIYEKRMNKKTEIDIRIDGLNHEKMSECDQEKERGREDKTDERNRKDKRNRKEKRNRKDKKGSSGSEEENGSINGSVTIWEQARSLSPAYAGRKCAMEAIGEEIAKKGIRYSPSYRELFIIELQYISPYFWLMQGILVAGLLLSFHMIPHEKHALAENMRWISIAAAWMGVVTCSDLGRHISKGMAELEQSCYFNLPQMWTMRMILTGIVDIMLLTACSGRIAKTLSAPFVQVCVYALVPFVLSNICCLLVFSFMRGGRGRYEQLSMALSAGIIAIVPSTTPSWYEIEFLGIWIGVLLAGAMLFLWQMRILYGKMIRGEILCWN